MFDKTRHDGDKSRWIKVEMSEKKSEERRAERLHRGPVEGHFKDLVLKNTKKNRPPVEKKPSKSEENK